MKGILSGLYVPGLKELLETAPGEAVVLSGMTPALSAAVACLAAEENKCPRKNICQITSHHSRILSPACSTTPSSLICVTCRQYPLKVSQSVATELSNLMPSASRISALYIRVTSPILRGTMYSRPSYLPHSMAPV